MPREGPFAHLGARTGSARPHAAANGSPGPGKCCPRARAPAGTTQHGVFLTRRCWPALASCSCRFYSSKGYKHIPNNSEVKKTAPMSATIPTPTRQAPRVVGTCVPAANASPLSPSSGRSVSGPRTSDGKGTGRPGTSAPVIPGRGQLPAKRPDLERNQSTGQVAAPFASRGGTERDPRAPPRRSKRSARAPHEAPAPGAD